ncbi:uncharacterized protein LOC131020511 isoform X1 [Salvia miltiorrhiza]|uniref:uncharacterized protein LOC131020511 isoform X1 n=1 Tax=Salvia miltiorrhiza TaxID=226208 RepID=UPI0025AC2A3B|nr:uncharacterized protein LOC131020511 isoform X1 [Salvia miltiorrhiza]
MDVNAITSGLYTDHSLRGSDVVNVEKKNANEDDRNTLFVNYAAIAWHEMRRAWRGDRSSASPKKPREPTRHWLLSLVPLSQLLYTRTEDGRVLGCSVGRRLICDSL